MREIEFTTIRQDKADVFRDETILFSRSGYVTVTPSLPTFHGPNPKPAFNHVHRKPSRSVQRRICLNDSDITYLCQRALARPILPIGNIGQSIITLPVIRS